MRLLLYTAIAAWLTASSCSYKRPADLILYNGRIYTVNIDFDIAEAVAVKDGIIKGVGTTKEILAKYQSVNKVDLGGKSVYPGFIDGHCHFFGYGMDMLKCNLHGTTSFEEVLDKITLFSKTNTFEWILGRGWDQNDWLEKEFPTKEKLDSLFPDIPVFLTRVDGHAVLCNQEALDRVKINSATKVAGGEIILKNGQVTGVLIDNAVDLVKNIIPSFTEEQRKQALLTAQKNCFAVGLTTVDDAGLGKDTIELINRLHQSGSLKMRIYAMLSDDERTLKYFFDHGTFKTDHLNVRSVKVYADGSLGSRGACLRKPYSDQPDHYGFLLHDISYFHKICEKAHDEGFQVCTHAIGDSAVRTILDVYDERLGTENDRRWRIEHCQVVDPDDLNKFSKVNVIPSVQPTHCTSDMYWAIKRLGADRVKNAYTYKDLLDNANNRIVFGTDFPVESINPLHTFYAAVERKDLKGYPEAGFQVENEIKKKDALRAMTIWAAWSNFEENEKGSIEESKFADLVILDQDILEIEESKIPEVKVIATFVGGEKVYGN